MSYKPSLLEQMQLDMGGRIEACQDLASVPVFVLRPRSAGQATMIQDSINDALAGAGLESLNGVGGAAILVDLPSGDIPAPETPGPDLRLGFSVRVFENPLINMGESGTQISAEDLVLFVLNLFHLWYVQRAGSTMRADKKPFVPVKEYLADGLVVYDCFFDVRMGLDGRKKTPRPAISGNSESGVTIIVPPGSTVWYTTDGTYPWSGNPTAVQLDLLIETDDGQQVDTDDAQDIASSTGPIAVASGTLVQAVAYNPNQQASDLAALTVS